MPAKEGTAFSLELDRRVSEGALGVLYEKLPDNKVRCHACAHRCLILDGLRGICKVRYNQGGVLKVPHGYVGALQCDPIEKKPFFHAFPGSDALTFGMLGCDLHCSYCFSGDVRVSTAVGMHRFDQLWEQAVTAGDENRRRPESPIQALGDDGRLHNVRWIFRHRYSGELVRILPRMIQPIEATPEHPILATITPGEEPQFIPAGRLTQRHFLAVARPQIATEAIVLDMKALLQPHLGRVRVGTHVPVHSLHQVVAMSAAGATSAAIGVELGLRADHVRHIRSRVARRGGSIDAMLARPETLVLEGAGIRFGQERRPGIPAQLPLTPDLAELLGYYCAEGGVLTSRTRPNSHTVVFAFGLGERSLADRCRALLSKVFGVVPGETVRDTTRAVSVGKASLGVVFRALCGSGSANKHLPIELFRAEPGVVHAFLNAYVAGDGHRYPNGKVSITTVSEHLAWDIAWLVLRLGLLPGLYKTDRPTEVLLLGRTVRIHPNQFTVVWYENPLARRLYREDDRYFYVPIRELTRRQYDGYVYNLETEDRHTYLANGVAVHNCQNWVTSQALRDPGALVEPMDTTPEQLVDLAEKYAAKLVATSYNEPLITSEWAVDVFKEARQRGFTTAYISNGNATKEVLEYIRPWTDLYKIDLKSMRDKNYRQLGGKLENILNGVRMVHAMGFWLEIVTLIIPGFNDSDEELGDIARFLAAISPDIPWHVTAFHKDYRMQDPDNTTPQTLLRAAAIGEASGLRYIYAGNLPGRVGKYEDTRCPGCQAALIRRVGYRIVEDRLSGRGNCHRCGEKIPGIWN